MLPSCAGVVLFGEDVLTWLQGQVTQDVTRAATLEAAWCKRTGHVEALCQIVQLSAKEVLIMTDRDTLEVVLGRVASHVILEDVSAKDFPAVAWSTVQGPNADTFIEEHFGEITHDVVSSPKALAWRHDRSGSGGWDIAWRVDPTFDGESTLTPHEEQQLRILRLLPKWGVDLTDSTLLPEMGPEFVERTVSYQKGCYLGQEVLMRIYSRGHTNWSWRLARANRPLSQGEQLLHEGKVVGQITSAEAWGQATFLATVRLRNEFAEPNTTIGDLTILGGPRESL